MLGVTVRRALQIGGLARGRVVAGLSGLDKVISYVDIMEVPDFAGWLRPNEFMLTCAYAIKDNPEAQVNLVRYLARSGAAGLAVKPGRFLGTMPEGMIQAADEEGLPLIELPIDLPYIEITHPLLSAILNEEVGELKYEAQVNKKLTELVVRQRGVEPVAQTLSELLKRNVYILDEYGNAVAASSGYPSSFADRQQVQEWLNGRVRAVGSSTRPGWSAVDRRRDDNAELFPVKAPGSVFGPSQPKESPVLGFIAIDLGEKGGLSPGEVSALERAATVAGLEFSSMKALRETERRLMAEFLTELLTGKLASEEFAWAKASGLGIDLEQPYSLIAAETISGTRVPRQKGRSLDEAGAGLAALVREEGKACGVKTVVTAYEPGLVALCLPASGSGPVRVRELAEHVVSRGQRRGQTVVVGVSAAQTGVHGVASGYFQAVHALRLGQIVRGAPSVTFYGEVSAYMLLQNLSRQQLESFWENELGELAMASNRTLVETLRALLESGGEVKQAAARLHVHRNTLRYRLRSIEKKLDCDLKDPDVQLRLRLGIVAGMLTGKLPPS